MRRWASFGAFPCPMTPDLRFVGWLPVSILSLWLRRSNGLPGFMRPRHGVVLSVVFLVFLSLDIDLRGYVEICAHRTACGTDRLLFLDRDDFILPIVFVFFSLPPIFEEKLVRNAPFVSAYRHWQAIEAVTLVLRPRSTDAPPDV